MKISKNSLIIVLILIFFGIFLGIQIRTNQFKSFSELDDQKKKALISVQIENEKDSSEKIKLKILGLHKANSDLIIKYDEFGKLNLLSSELERVSLLAGMKDVSGSGVEITMDDSSLTPEERGDDNPNWYVIHDKDVIRVINELRKAGAQAISINGERIVSTSEQVCAGATIIVNGKRYITPFIIRAIGDSALLYDSIFNSSVFLELNSFSIPFKIEKKESIKIDAFVQNAFKGGN
ncbi:MAG: DUF881 domain-containing protein [Bacillota bacterium]